MSLLPYVWAVLPALSVLAILLHIKASIVIALLAATPFVAFALQLLLHHKDKDQ